MKNFILSILILAMAVFAKTWTVYACPVAGWVTSECTKFSHATYTIENGMIWITDGLNHSGTYGYNLAGWVIEFTEEKH